MKNGTCWLDDSGELIQAHGGMVICFDGTWYWYGENKNGDTIRSDAVGTRVNVIGISCYSSRDLAHWHYEGLALKSDPSRPDTLIHPSCVMERPKVMRSKTTGKYVMWFHADSADYWSACAGCAIADRPEGPFEFLRAVQPNRRDCRDMTLFEDPVSGKTYLVHSGDWNKTLYFSALTEDGTDFTGECFAQLENQEREGAALCYHEGRYYCVTSGCTGWNPNPTLYAVTRHLNTPMKLIDNPCEGEKYHTTFDGQSTYIFEANGVHYLMLDHWHKDDLKRSGYSFLPIEFQNGAMHVRWQPEFNGLA